MQTKLMLAVVLFTMSSCLAVVSGDGVKREEVRSVSEFHSFGVGWGFETVATLGVPASVTLESDQNILRAITTTVVDGKLIIDAPEGTLLLPVNPVKIKIVSPTLTGVDASGGSVVTMDASPSATFQAEASGSSKITIRGLQSELLLAHGSGMSRITIEGAAREAELSFSGASAFDGDKVPFEAVRFDGSGGSSGTVRATRAVTGGLSGGSHLTVIGQPARLAVETSGGSAVNTVD